jgi:pilus assembly protein CpaF
VSSLAERLAAARKQSEAGANPTPPPPPRGPEPQDTPPAAPPRGGGDDGDDGGRPRTAPLSASRIARRGSAEHDRLEELKQDVHTELLKQLGPQLYDANLDQAELDQRVRAVLGQLMSSQDRPISNADRNRLTQEISDDILGYGPIEPFLRDTDVSEVMVNAHDSIWLEKGGKLVKANAQFSDEAHIRRTIDKIVSRIGRRVD